MRGNVARSFAVDRAIFKYSGSVAEDEINMAFDVAIFVILSSPVREQRVLPTQKATVAKHGTIGIDIGCDRLRSNTVRIFKRDLFSAKVAAAKICSVRESRVTRSLRAEIERQRGFQSIVSL